MAVAFDAVGPSGGAGASATGSPATSPLTWSHVPASGAALLVGICCDNALNGTVSVTGVTFGGVSMTQLGSVNVNAGSNGALYVFGLANVTGGSQTVSVSFASGGGNPDQVTAGSMSYTGADTSAPFGTFQSATSATGSPTLGFTTTSSSSMVVGFEADGGSSTPAMSAGTLRTAAGRTSAGNCGTCGGGDAAGTGGTVTLTFSQASADPWGLGGVEVLPPGGVTFTRQRYGQAAAPSPAPWEQRAYISVPGAVDTPANPLVSPLDSAWQADAAWSHLYADSHLRDRRAYFYQRALVSDPNLLAPPVNADPLQLNPEQSDSSDLWRIAAVPAFYDRRLYPQQRAYYDVTLLATAQLENELLGGADTARHQHAAAYADRREVPQQPARLADPLLIQTAQLENELLGGAQTWLHYTTADWYDRREVPQQRAYISVPGAVDTPANPLDTLLAGQDYLEVHQHQAATHYDRREVPQQRPYISDPSFYPSVAATDPLTVAWGAGGPYWHLYQRAADIGDRRAYFTQRLYQSDPLLLLSALLENELLGGAETGKYYRTPATHADRRLYPQQRAYYDVTLLATAQLENEMLGGADTARYYLTAAYWDRREVPQQRAYISDPSFYPTGAVTDPLTVAWGAGGNYWHLYQRAADITDRRLVPQQRSYVSDPLVLGTALLENELLGGAQTWMHYVTAAYADRREVPQQRPYGYDPNLLLGPLDPTTAAWADLARRYGLAATHADRRLYPQQRLYFPVPPPPPAFTIGTLTAGTAPFAVLTAADARGGASGGALTATDQRTGGPS